MTHNPKSAKRPYEAPSFKMFDASAAKPEMRARSKPKDAFIRQTYEKLQDFLGYNGLQVLVVAIVLGCALILAVAYLMAQR